jgi:hypothetical protein
MNNEIYEFFSCDINSLLKTEAPDGRYMACSSLLCDCCGEPITASKPLVVRNGVLEKRSVLNALRELINCHPGYTYLESITWDGGGSFTCTFIE